MTSASGPGAARSELPVACTLSQSDLQALSSRWARLAASAQAEDGLRIAFSADADGERELAELVAVERDCCAWASWSVERSEDRLVLVVSADGEGVGALHGMFTGVSEDGPNSAG
jgi:hypothetical protein